MIVTDQAIYSVWVGGVEVNNYPLTASQAIDISHEWAYRGYEDVQIDVTPDASQQSYSWSEMAELTHATQIKIFGWCGCEDNDGNENPYADCPVTSIID